VFQESDGALIFKGSEHGSFDNVFVNRNGQGLYAARDLGLIQLKNEQYHPNKSYIVTAEEQKDYFKGVLAAAGLAMPELNNVTVNIPTGTVKLTTGKMSSRDGDVVEIGWLFDQVAEAIRARGGEATDDIVAGALRYAFLKVRIGGDVVFDINESVSIQGNSGPYLQYAHARACSILEKAGKVGVLESDVAFDDYERLLVRKLSEYAEVVEKATEELLPHSICTYLYELAQEFNRFYEQCRIIGDERERLRFSLVLRYKNTLKNGLSLLGMVAPDKM
jgi:arginyl-tRNA synthetase